MTTFGKSHFVNNIHLYTKVRTFREEFVLARPEARTKRALNHVLFCVVWNIIFPKPIHWSPTSLQNVFDCSTLERILYRLNLQLLAAHVGLLLEILFFFPLFLFSRLHNLIEYSKRVYIQTNSSFLLLFLFSSHTFSTKTMYDTNERSIPSEPLWFPPLQPFSRLDRSVLREVRPQFIGKIEMIRWCQSDHDGTCDRRLITRILTEVRLEFGSSVELMRRS